MIQKIDHVGIAVQSIDEALKLYQALGLEVEGYEDVPSEGVRVAMIRCGESRIELLEATTDDSPIARFLAKRGGGLHHICLATTDVRADQESLEAGGTQAATPRAHTRSRRLLGPVHPSQKRIRRAGRAIGG